MNHQRSTRVLAVLLTSVSLAAAEKPKELQRIKYNHPGLIVDLGVELWAWPLPMDFDGDGDWDLVVNCPDKPSNGVYFFENPSQNATPNKLPVFKPGRRISEGLQNVQVSFVGGRPVVLSPGIEYPDFLTTGLQDGKKLPVEANVHPNKVRGNMWRWVDYDGDGREDLIVGADDWTDYGWDNAYDADGHWTRGPLRGFVYWLKNLGQEDDQKFAEPVKVMAGDQPVEVFGWPSPNFADFDADGDLDLLCGEFLDGFTYFENQGTRSEPKYSTGSRLETADRRPLVMDLEMITPTAVDWDNDGDFDLIVGDEDGRVAFIEHTGQLNHQRRPIFHAPIYFQQLADYVKCGALATPVGFDWDGDGDDDILSGNTAGYIEFFENLSGTGVETPQWAAPQKLMAAGQTIRLQAGPNGSIQGPCEAKWGYTTQSIADWDQDGRPDIVANSILGQVHWYRNVGSRQRPELAAALPIEVAWRDAPPTLKYGWLRPRGNELLTQWRTTPVAADFNRDGLVDLVMLYTDGFLAFYERAVVDGRRVLLPPQRVLHGENFSQTDSRNKVLDSAPGAIQLNSGIAGRSGRRKLCIVDWDRDGNLDILVNSANANFLRQTDRRDGRWIFRDEGLLVGQNIEGHDVSPTTVDFNGDGLPDFLGGAEDGRFYYLRNPWTR